MIHLAHQHTPLPTYLLSASAEPPIDPTDLRPKAQRKCQTYPHARKDQGAGKPYLQAPPDGCLQHAPALSIAQLLAQRARHHHVGTIRSAANGTGAHAVPSAGSVDIREPLQEPGAYILHLRISGMSHGHMKTGESDMSDIDKVKG